VRQIGIECRHKHCPGTSNNSSEESRHRDPGTKRKTRKPWISAETLKLADEKRIARTKRHNSATLRRAYNTLCKLTKESQRWTKQSGSRSSAGRYRELHLGKDKRSIQSYCCSQEEISAENQCNKRQKGIVLTQIDDVLRRWKEYCEELYSNNTVKTYSCSRSYRTSHHRRSKNSGRYTTSGGEQSRHKLKNRKGIGVDGIPGELLKASGDATKREIHELCNRVWKEEKVPDEWEKQYSSQYLKREIPRLHELQTISLITHLSKILLNVILERLKSETEEAISEEQAGFRSGRSTIQQILSLRLMLRNIER